MREDVVFNPLGVRPIEEAFPGHESLPVEKLIAVPQGIYQVSFTLLKALAAVPIDAKPLCVNQIEDKIVVSFICDIERMTQTAPRTLVAVNVMEEVPLGGQFIGSVVRGWIVLYVFMV